MVIVRGILWIVLVTLLAGCASSTGTTTSSSDSGGAAATAVTSTAQVAQPTPTKGPPPTLVSIDVWPPVSRTAVGSGVQFSATGIFSDDSRRDLTRQVAWTSSSSALATVSQNGFASGAAAGEVTITAAQGGVSQSSALTVSNAMLQSIVVTSLTPTIAQGTRAQLAATGVYSDMSTQDLTPQVAWSASSASVTVDGQGLAFGQSPSSNVVVTATMGGVSGTRALTVTAATLTSLNVQPALAGVSLGMSQQFSATGVFSDGSVQDMTSTVQWLPPSADKARQAGAGSEVVVAETSGQTDVPASLGGVTASGDLAASSATLQSVTITPGRATISRGTSVQLTATGTYSDQSTRDLTKFVTWTSTADVRVSNSEGSYGQAVGLAVTPGATVIALYQGLVATASVQVGPATLKSITISPAGSTLPVGATAQLTATGTFTDGTAQDLTGQVSWVSSSAATLVVSSGHDRPGLAGAIAAGTATVTATMGDVSTSTTVVVTTPALEAITIGPASLTVPRGQTQQLTATGRYGDASERDVTQLVSWSSSSDQLSISNATGTRGLATALTPFEAHQGGEVLSTVYATLATVRSNPVSVRVTNSSRLVVADGRIDHLTQYDIGLGGVLSFGSSIDMSITNKDQKIGAEIHFGDVVPSGDGNLLTAIYTESLGTAAPPITHAYAVSAFTIDHYVAGLESRYSIGMQPYTGLLDGQLIHSPFFIPTTPQWVSLAFAPGGRFAYLAVASATSATTYMPAVEVHRVLNNGFVDLFGTLSSNRVGNTASTTATGFANLCVAVDPLGRFVYVSDSKGAAGMIYPFASSQGVLTAITTPQPYLSAPGVIAMKVHPGGNFLYATSRDFLYGFQVDATGPSFPQSASMRNATPCNDLAIDPQGTTLVTVGSTLSVYQIDPQDGSLQLMTTLPPRTFPIGENLLKVTFDPSGQTIYATSATNLYGYSLDRSARSLTAVPGLPLTNIRNAPGVLTIVP